MKFCSAGSQQSQERSESESGKRKDRRHRISAVKGLRQKHARVTLPRKTSAREVPEHACGHLTPEELQNIAFKSCSLGLNARGTVGGISESPCATRELRLLSSYSTDDHHCPNLIKIL